jgi:nucleoside-diphosphate-sugar epimerase
MHILVTGASGFIASQIVTDLLHKGHTVTCCVRNTAYTQRLFPQSKVIACNFITDTHADIWEQRLRGIDIVINCVGILYHPNKKIIWAIHRDTPIALFDACVKAGIKKIIQISALGIEANAFAYAASKKAADDYLLTLPLSSIILRPSVVYGKGSYGGTSLFRGLAGLPYIIPMPGNGKQELQPIHIADLSRAVSYLIVQPSQSNRVLVAAGTKPHYIARNVRHTTNVARFFKTEIYFNSVMDDSHSVISGRCDSVLCDQFVFIQITRAKQYC